MTPVTVITGVVSRESGRDASVIDFYRASLPGVDADEFIGEYVAAQGGSVYPLRIATWGYDQVHEIRNGDRRLAIIRHGGNGGAPISVEADGFESREFAAFVRRRWPSHYCTNIHSALDFDSEGVWGQMLDLHCDIGQMWPKLHRSEVGCLMSGKGASVYQGAPSSAIRTILYQKGMQKEYRHHQRPNWCRAEARYRPQKPSERVAAASMPSGVVWGASRHSRLIHDRLTGFAAPVCIRETPRETDLERRFGALVRQYGRTLLEVRDMLGSWDAVGEAITAGRLPSADQCSDPVTQKE